MSDFDYTSSDVPAWYSCRNCLAHGVRLFRLSFARQLGTEILCIDCVYLKIGDGMPSADATTSEYQDSEAIHRKIGGGISSDNATSEYQEADAIDLPGPRCPAIPMYTDDEVMVSIYALRDDRLAWWQRLPLRVVVS
jgi:hypothetical protein